MKRNEFTFSQVGKRMPYTTPDQFFEQMEANVMRVVEQQPQSMVVDSKPVTMSRKQRPMLKPLLSFIVSVAAVVALFFVGQHVNRTFFAPQPTNSMQQVDQAFAHLSTADQDFLLEVYQDDVFFEE